jgi:uncharacterized protein with HEPN domain
VTRSFRLRLLDIDQAIQDTRNFLDGAATVRDILVQMEDRKTFRALVSALHDIGEAIKNIPEDARARHPGFDWRAAGRMRDIIAHQYFGLNRTIIARTIQDDIPTLAAIVADELARLDKDSS